MLGAKTGLIIASLVLVTAATAGPARAADSDAINAVIGDASWVEAHGAPPDASATEIERIQTHLRYVLRALRAADVSGLSLDQQRLRRASLAALERYADRGVFPRRSGDDGYVGRRPRFIDDRGVHCAVGYLIATSGAPELARALDAEYEYSYVREMKSAALLDWAAAHGFAVVELAMIQPGYAAIPTEQSTRRLIAEAADRLTIECAREHPAPAAIRLRVRGDASGRATVTSVGDNRFGRCFARLASELEAGDGAYMGSPRAYEFGLRLAIERPQVLFERAVGRLQLGGNNTGCLPRPGAVPRSAVLSAATDREGLRVTVRGSGYRSHARIFRRTARQ